MNLEKARSIAADMDGYVRRDRILLNNPVVMQGMGLAPLVIADTTGRNGLMLCAAVAMLLTPTRVALSLLLNRLGDKITGLARAVVCCGIAALVYIPVYVALSALFGSDLLQLGVYLPILVVEPIVIYRYARKPEPLRKAIGKGLRITLGYGLILLFVGCARELLAAGSLFGAALLPTAPFPLLGMPTGGFLLVGVVCAVWRAAVRGWKKRVMMEARTTE